MLVPMVECVRTLGYGGTNETARASVVKGVQR